MQISAKGKRTVRIRRRRKGSLEEKWAKEKSVIETHGDWVGFKIALQPDSRGHTPGLASLFREDGLPMFLSFFKPIWQHISTRDLLIHEVTI